MSKSSLEIVEYFRSTLFEELRFLIEDMQCDMVEMEYLPGVKLTVYYFKENIAFVVHYHIKDDFINSTLRAIEHGTLSQYNDPERTMTLLEIIKLHEPDFDGSMIQPTNWQLENSVKSMAGYIQSYIVPIMTHQLWRKDLPISMKF